MIISREHDFGFVHIAKCAGSTIRHQLRDLDDLGGRYYATIHHPELGPINGQHVPLDILRRYFPDDFEALRQVTSYTVTRAPRDRFASGLSQLIRDRGDEPAELSADRIEACAQSVIDYMEQLSGMPDREHILFARQSDYVMLDGEQIVSKVYAMETLDALFDEMEHRHGLSLMRDKVWNPTVTYRYPALTGAVKSLKDVAKAVLPMRAYVAARDVGVRHLTRKGVPKLTETIFSSSAILDFVDSYYAADDILHRTAVANGASSSA